MMLETRPSVRVAPRRFAAFAAGIAAVALAALLDRLGTAVLSAHMTEHLLLTVVAPPLLVWSRADLLFRRNAPPAWHRLARPFARIVRLATHPVVAWLLLCVPFIAWHLPGPYEWMRGSDVARSLAFASFLLGALAFWAAVMTRARRGQIGTALLLVAATAGTTSLPGALLSFAPHVIYRGLPDPFPICGLTAVEDQQLAGLIMWIPMDIILLAAAAWLFVAWLRESERRVSLNARQASAALSLLLLIPLLAGCDERPDAANAAPGIGGDARRGAELMERYGCGTCHTVPGLPDAQGLVGPPLTKMGRRVYIAGVLRNSPDNMMMWLQDPQRIHPGNAMPNMGIGPDDARDLTAYLFTLR